MNTLWRLIGFVILTLWWLPLGIVTLIGESGLAFFACVICAAIVVLLRFPLTWKFLSRFRQRDTALAALRWLFFALPFIAALLAYKSANMPQSLSPRLWLQLALAGGALAFPACIAALLLVAPLLGAKSEDQRFSFLSAAVIGYVATAYRTAAPKIQLESQGAHIDSIDAMASAMWVAPTAAILLGLAMAAVVSREEPQVKVTAVQHY